MVLKADKHTPVYVIAVLVLHHTPSVVGPQHALGCATNVADGDSVNCTFDGGKRI